MTPAKLATGTGGEVSAATQLNPAGGVVSSSPKKIKVVNWQTSGTGQVSESGIVEYPHAFAKSCLPIATAATFGSANGTGGLPVVTAVRSGRSGVQVAADAPTFIHLTIVCPR